MGANPNSQSDMTVRALLLLATLALAAAAGEPAVHAYSYARAHVVRGSGDVLTLVPAPPSTPGPDDAPFAPPSDAVAWGEYADSSASPSGTGQLHIATSGAAGDSDQMFAAGVVEGFLTAARIADYYQNTWTYFTSPTGLNATLGSPDDPASPLGWLEAQDAWARGRVAAARGGGDARWRTVGLLLDQFDGLVEGYRVAAAAGEAGTARVAAASTPNHHRSALPPLSAAQLRFLNGNGDLYDVIEHFRRREEQASSPSLPFPLTPRPTYARLATAGRCSALVAVSPDLDDVYVGHATWDSFSQATKVFKHVSTALGGVGVPLASQRVSYSSFPGELSSDDDLYITPHLILASTSLHILNPHLYTVLPPTVLLSWQRVRAATLLATTGAEWASLFAADNSGTYNNEFLVVTPSLFVPGDAAPLRPGLLTVVDQIPHLVTVDDATADLARGHFPSYNLPSSPRVYNACGLADANAVTASLDAPLAATRWLSYQLAPRAALFRRDGGGVASLARMRDVMRSVYNKVGEGGKEDGKEAPSPPPTPLDPLAHGDALAAVCGRADLEADPVAREPRGCFDGKVTSVRSARELSADVVTGPSTAGGVLPPFRPADWSAVIPTAGMPAVFDFDWERTRPRLVACSGREEGREEGGEVA